MRAAKLRRPRCHEFGGRRVASATRAMRSRRPTMSARTVPIAASQTLTMAVLALVLASTDALPHRRRTTTVLPRVDVVSPNYANIGAVPPPSLTVTGANFTGGRQAVCRLSNHLLLATVETPWRLRCASPVTALPHAAALALSTDGAGFGPAANFTFYDAALPPALSATTPTSGPLAGGAAVTLRASNLAPTGALHCAFGSLGVVRASLVGGTAARCEAPPAAAAHTAEVRLSHDGGASWSAPQRFTYVSGAPPALHRAQPRRARSRRRRRRTAHHRPGRREFHRRRQRRAARRLRRGGGDGRLGNRARCAAPTGGASRTVLPGLLLARRRLHRRAAVHIRRRIAPRIASVAPAAADLSAPPLRWTIVGDGFAPPSCGCAAPSAASSASPAFTNATHRAAGRRRRRRRRRRCGRRVAPRAHRRRRRGRWRRGGGGAAAPIRLSGASRARGRDARRRRRPPRRRNAHAVGSQPRGYRPRMRARRRRGDGGGGAAQRDARCVRCRRCPRA